MKLRAHGMAPLKPRVEGRFLRYRIQNPTQFDHFAVLKGTDPATRTKKPLELVIGFY